MMCWNSCSSFPFLWTNPPQALCNLHLLVSFLIERLVCLQQVAVKLEGWEWDSTSRESEAAVMHGGPAGPVAMAAASHRYRLTSLPYRFFSPAQASLCPDCPFTEVQQCISGTELVSDNLSVYSDCCIHHCQVRASHRSRRSSSQHALGLAR